MNKSKMKILVAGKFQVTKRLGNGAFGELYAGINIRTLEEVAIKLEKLTTKTPVLAYEANICKKMSSLKGFAKVYWSGIEGDF
jgi:predicted Ser/Thr protein kinase